MGRYDVLLTDERRRPQETEMVSPRPATAEKPTRQANRIEPERANARTPVHPNGKRIITRNSFEIYEDLMDDLRELSLEEKRQGKLGSMSAMVREAISAYIAERRKSK
jgi:hypothetical protein